MTSDNAGPCFCDPHGSLPPRQLSLRSLTNGIGPQLAPLLDCARAVATARAHRSVVSDITTCAKEKNGPVTSQVTLELYPPAGIFGLIENTWDKPIERFYL